MGWAIRRPDGTYRAWNAITQDDVLQAGETWVSLDTAPVITAQGPPDPVLQKLTIVLASTAIPASLKDLLVTLVKR